MRCQLSPRRRLSIQVPPELRVVRSTGTGSGLYTMPFSVGLFKMMELAGVELSKANAEEAPPLAKSARPSSSFRRQA